MGPGSAGLRQRRQVEDAEVRDQAELPTERRRPFRTRQRQLHIVGGYFGGSHVQSALDESLMSF
ncbi:hypothetical protein [Streptomyces sp. STCH 565 A]|uniref:hypothetical protein n=1 Tax=Streptomyces sp. STCH 565 A TaxID=2950532 RepID=UPI002075C5D0|nr:hypothetical protein [Streptomyces sp. STCH 565 A]MCM8554265.1 hypothetical protein [Streptomyces sp. STCH 565 A]